MDQLIEERFRILDLLEKGGFGVVYRGVDIQTQQIVAIKINTQEGVNSNESNIMREIEYKNLKVMQMLEKSLKDVIKGRRNVFSTKTVCQIGIQIVNHCHCKVNFLQLNRLKDLHELGYLHLDIKPDNILIQTEKVSNKNSTKSMLYLIDFGISQTYLDKDGLNHKQMKTNEQFNGNLIFSQSRRDDIISLGYLLLFLFNGQVPWVKKSNVPLKNQYNSIFKFKTKMKPEEICRERACKKNQYHNSELAVLLPFMIYADRLNYDEKPDYGYLKHIMLKILLDKDLIPDQIYDWDILNVIIFIQFILYAERQQHLVQCGWIMHELSCHKYFFDAYFANINTDIFSRSQQIQKDQLNYQEENTSLINNQIIFRASDQGYRYDACPLTNKHNASNDTREKSNQNWPSLVINQEAIKRAYQSKSPMRIEIQGKLLTPDSILTIHKHAKKESFIQREDKNSMNSRYFESYVESLNYQNAKFERQYESSKSSGNSLYKAFQRRGSPNYKQDSINIPFEEVKEHLISEQEAHVDNSFHQAKSRGDLIIEVNNFKEKTKKSQTLELPKQNDSYRARRISQFKRLNNQDDSRSDQSDESD
ncbi:protein kinase-like protein [Stylonychia lemnae]|uniref:Casein kinase I n=1 Tax=Stylonychia lemnae TaxID=5949 RepID=A0A078AN32_STYLE|nr:protein kinase-like protein [Stylonychia lemnae]|eukprot:CDW82767.1 protein kinase-like protein [Stylonychia lemnae]